MAPFPENFRLLHTGEETFRSQSISAIEESDVLSAHVGVMEPAISLLRHCLLRDDHRDEDDLAIRLLGIRITNGITAALQTLLSGYYQVSILQQRDLIETIFLFEHLLLDRTRIAIWRTGDEKVHRTHFAPVVIRKALDAHYDHTEKKREAAYKLYSTLAAHPHPKGFAMLRTPDGLHQCGPFFEVNALTIGLEELVKHAVMAGELIGTAVKLTTREDREIQFAFFNAKLHWYARFFGQPIDEAALKGMRAAIDRIPQ